MPSNTNDDMLQSPLAAGNEPSASLEPRPIENIVQEADIQQHMNATYRAVEESPGIPVDKMQDGAYLYRLKVCGFSVFSVRHKKERTHKYITKVFGMDIIFPIIAICFCFVYFPTLAAVVLPLLFWLFIFFLSYDEANIRDRARSTLRSTDGLRRSDISSPEKRGRNRKNDVASSDSAKPTDFEDDSRYDLADGEISSVMGGF